MSKSSQGDTVRRRAVSFYDSRTSALRRRTLVTTIVTFVFAAFVGSAQTATWPQVLILHRIGWAVVGVFAAGALAGAATSTLLERRGYAKYLAAYKRLAEQKAQSAAETAAAPAAPPVPARQDSGSDLAGLLVPAAPAARPVLPAPPVPMFVSQPEPVTADTAVSHPAELESAEVR